VQMELALPPQGILSSVDGSVKDIIGKSAFYCNALHSALLQISACTAEGAIGTILKFITRPCMENGV